MHASVRDLGDGTLGRLNGRFFRSFLLPLLMSLKQPERNIIGQDPDGDRKTEGPY
jgi:hypothetical protein